MGGKSATTTSKVSVPPEVLARYNAVNARAETAAAKPFQAYGTTAADYVAPINAQQRAGFSDINATAGSYQPYIDSATTATTAGMGPAFAGIDRYMSPYIKNVADTTGALLKQQYEQAQSGALGNAISSGAFGGDRAGIAAANLQQQNQMGYGKTMADIYNQGYTQALGASQADLARQLQGGAQMAGLGAQSQQLGLQGAQAKIAAGTMEQQTGQAGIDAMINRFMQEQGLPYQQAQFLANIAMGTGAASGSTTTTQTPRNWMGFANGGVAGPRTYTQSGVGSEGYVPAGDLPVGQLMVANPPDQQQSNGTDEIIKLIAMMGGKAGGGAVDQRHGYALDGEVKPSYSGNTELLRSYLRDREKFRAENPSHYDTTGRLTDSLNLGYLMRQPTNPANMGMGATSSKTSTPNHPYPTYPNAPTTGVTPPNKKYSAQDMADYNAAELHKRNLYTIPEGLGALSAPNDDAAHRAVMAKALGAREPRASERYMLPTGLVRPPVNALEELNLGAGDPFGAYTESARPPVVSEKPPTISSRVPASLTSPDGVNGGVRLPDADVTSPILPSSPPRLAGLAGADLASTISQSPPPYPDGLGAADVAADTMKTINVGNTPMDVPTGISPVHIPTDWDAAKAKIIPRESGNDPNALLGFANREGGAFAGTKLTDMTVDQAIEFSRPGSPYANYSKEKLGYIATPMGTFQIVGSTLNSAKAEMGLTGNEVMTPELQERIAKHLYDTYGMKPWAASEGAIGGLGGGTADGLGGANMAQQRGGLFNPDKPYEDRNFLGKFFYNPNGSLNQNSLLSVLMGIGKGAEAQTISPLGGILSGIGAGAEAYKGLQKQAADIGFTNAQTATEAVQLLKNSIYYDANLGMSVIPLAGGGQQSLADFVVNPAGPSMAGPAMDGIIRSIVSGASSRGVDLTTATPEEIFSGAPVQTGQGAGSQTPAAGMPVPPVVTPYESFGTFPMGDAEQAYIAQAETRARMAMNPTERQAVTERSESTRAAADAGTASSSLAFRNTNELAATVAKAAANNDLGPLGGVISTYEGLASQLAGAFGIQYDGSAATSQALLNKLSSLSADQMTADTAAASLYLQNKNIFPDITSNATAAAEITAEMLTRNMLAYEKGQYINDLYRAQKGIVKDLTGADALFTRQAGNIYQGEKANIAELLKYAGDAEADAEVKQLVVDFFDSANKGAFTDQADAQAALEAIFTILPGQHNVSSGLGRYFVQ